MNTKLLYVQQSDLKYYSIISGVTGDHYDIVQFSTLSDKLNFVNYTVMNVKNLSVANQDIYTGLFFYDRIKIWSNIFHTHSNTSTSNPVSLVDSQDVIVPISVEPMAVQ